MESQNKQIRKYLESGYSITAIDALNLFGCFRLASRIYDLKQQGMDIKSELVYKNGKRFAQYRIKH